MTIAHVDLSAYDIELHDTVDLVTKLNDSKGAVQTKMNEVVDLANTVSDLDTAAASAEADRILAEAASASTINNALAAQAAAAAATDSTARIAELLVTRGITNIKAIAFKSAEGWEKTGNQSYKSETRPTGRFLGDYANATAAWAANVGGVATVAGDYYWQTSGTIGQFECTTTNNSVQVYRGASDHMPLEAVFVFSGTTTSSRLQIFDLTDPLMPLWMDFTATANTLLACSSAPTFTGFRVAQRMFNGKLFFGTNGGGGGASFRVIDFRDDSTRHYNASNSFTFAGKIAQRNSALGYKTIDSQSISNALVNSVAAHNGYVAVATAGGLSVVKPDGTVVKSSVTNQMISTVILGGRLYSVEDLAADAIKDWGPIESLGASFTAVNTWTNATVPALSSSTLNTAPLGVGNNSLLLPSASAVDQLWPNPADYTSSLIARQGTTFATPPMKKPECMLICSTLEGSVSDASLIDDTFDSDAEGWTESDPFGNISIAWDGVGALEVNRTNGTTNTAYAYSTGFSIEAGKAYRFTADVTYVSGTVSGSFGIRTTNNYSPATLASTTLNSGSDTTINSSFVAGTSQTVYAGVTTATTAFTVKIDNVRVEEVIADFSGLSNHATINGTLTATAEVTGGVAGLSGWSAANCLAMPYDASLDVDTGDITIPFAFKSAGNSADETLFCRSDTAHAAARISGVLLTAGTLSITINGTAIVTSTSTYDDGLLHTGLFYRRSGVAYLELDGQVVASAANTTDLDNATAIMRVGVRADDTLPATTSTIWFVGAAATSPSRAEADLMHTHMRNLIMGKASLDEIPSALAYNPLTKAVEMAGATYHQTMIDGAIVSSVAHGQGTTPAIAAGSRGEIGVGGTTGISTTVPERNLREYQARLAKERFVVKYAGDATGSRVLFPLPTTAAEMAVTIGAKPVRVSNAGVVQTEGAAEDYTVKDYGLGRYVVQFAVAPADANDVCVEFEREVYR